MTHDDSLLDFAEHHGPSPTQSKCPTRTSIHPPKIGSLLSG
jgi:hypothetical protein